MADPSVGAKGTEAPTEDEAMHDAASEQEEAEQMDMGGAGPAMVSKAAAPAEPEPLTGFAAGQAAGNIHLAGGDAEVMELGAASLEAQVHTPILAYLCIDLAASVRA